MSGVLPTVKIQTKNGPVDINLSDYDATKHKLVDAKDMPPLQPLHPNQKQKLFSSTVQPASWKLPNGETLTLETVTEEAFKRSGHNEDGWNGLSQDDREQAIAAVVTEMVPPVPAFTVGKKRGAGNTQKFVIKDASGKQVGEEFDTEEDAKAQAKVLAGEEAA